MEIKGFLKTSFVDWDGKIVSVIWLPKCNFRCQWCYDRDLVLEYEKMPNVPFEEIKDYILKYKKFIDGLVITGGEPTLHEDLPDLCKRIKEEIKVPIKLDTNGTNPEMVKKLFKEKLIDYVATDVKANPKDEEKYTKVNGNCNLVDKVRESIKFYMTSRVDYEFRTTVVPGLHNEKDIEEIGKYIKGAKKWGIQNFVIPEGTNKFIDPSYINVKPFSKEKVEKFGEIARKYVKNVVLRNI